LAPEFDLAVIGAGASGLSLTAIAARLGVRVALIESERMGGDCLNTGCVPSKALLAAAHACRVAQEAGKYGLRLPEPVIEWRAVRTHVDGAIAAISPADSEARYRALGATVLREQARFMAPDALEVGGRRLTARRIVVAAGSRPAIPAIPGLGAVPYLTNETVFSIPEQPAHLLILGGGAIGLEMADAHAALGSRVTVIEADVIASREDPELVGGLCGIFRARGIELIEHATVAAVEAGPRLRLADGRVFSGSHLLVATGRRPDLEKLGLEAGGVRASRAGIATDRGLRSLTNRRVFAIGDIADPIGLGPRAYTHLGLYHAGIVARRVLFRLPARLDYSALPRVIYTDPELAQVGLTEAEARGVGRKALVIRWPLADNDRGQVERQTQGLVKLVVAPSGLVLGAGILGPHAGEMITPWTLAISRRIPLSAIATMIMPYPTRSEAGKRAAGEFYAPRLFAQRTRGLVRLLARLP
jgi:pyruvate/2-oxoglutarate dehydrogenase complex dihydrolipoamide dehydrogenase (E3) component